LSGTAALGFRQPPKGSAAPKMQFWPESLPADFEQKTGNRESFLQPQPATKPAGRAPQLDDPHIVGSSIAPAIAIGLGGMSPRFTDPLRLAPSIQATPSTNRQGTRTQHAANQNPRNQKTLFSQGFFTLKPNIRNIIGRYLETLLAWGSLVRLAFGACLVARVTCEATGCQANRTANRPRRRGPSSVRRKTPSLQQKRKYKIEPPPRRIHRRQTLTQVPLDDEPQPSRIPFDSVPPYQRNPTAHFTKAKQFREFRFFQKTKMGKNENMKR